MKYTEELRSIAHDAPMAAGTRTRLHAIAHDIDVGDAQLRAQLSDRIEERDDSNRNLTAALRRETQREARLAAADVLLTEARELLHSSEWPTLCKRIDAHLESADLRPEQPPQESKLPKVKI